MKLTHEILCKLADKYSLDWCDDYGERGYTTENGVILGNWNDIPSFITRKLEKEGYSIEWSDEWYIDYNRSKCYRTSGDSWHWQPSVVWFDSSEPFTIDEVEEDPTEYLEQLENDPERCDCFRVNLAEHGYELIDDSFEHGWHPGQTDDPHKILTTLLKKEPEGVFVFQLKENSQFYSRFSVWRKLPSND